MISIFLTQTSGHQIAS